MPDPDSKSSSTGRGAPKSGPSAGSFRGQPPQQIGLVVSDLDAALRKHVEILGMAPWICLTHGPDTVPRLEYRGRPASFSMRAALSASTPQIELIQPLTGPNIYFDWMEAHGEGLHHLAYDVASIDDGIAEMRDLGYALIQYGAGYGLDGDGAFAYFDTEADLGTIIELRVPPLRRAPTYTVVDTTQPPS